MLPRLLSSPNVLNMGYILAIIAVFIIYFILRHTTSGYEMKAVGINPTASKWAGISVDKNAFLALIISGGLAGLAG